MLILLKTEPKKGKVPAADAAKAYSEGKRYSCTRF
jgi:hypothetical protein